jgi:hypothetical protein
MKYVELGRCLLGGYLSAFGLLLSREKHYVPAADGVAATQSGTRNASYCLLIGENAA